MTPRRDAERDPNNPRTWPVERAESYGGVVVRTTAAGPEVALIRPRTADGKIVWALPKGAKKEEGEVGSEAALREVKEETGLDAEVVEALEPITYWFTWAPEKVRYRKTVHYFLMRIRADVGPGVGTAEPKPDGYEVAEVRFFPLRAAHKQATYPSERKILKAAAELAASW